MWILSMFFINESTKKDALNKQRIFVLNESGLAMGYTLFVSTY